MRRLVLIGATRGPWCGISQIKNPALHIVGLKQGVVDIELYDGQDVRHLAGFSRNGIYCLTDGSYMPPIEKLEWIKATASQANRELICTVIPFKAA